MLSRLLRAFGGVPASVKADRMCREWFANLCANLEANVGDDRTIALMKEADFQTAFFKTVSAACAEIFEEPGKGSQKTRLRRYIVDFYERSHSAKHYLSKNDDERQILAERFFAPNSRCQTDQQCAFDVQLFNVAALVIRNLGGKYFGDFRNGDWFVVMSAASRRVIEYRMNVEIQRAKGDALLPLVEAALETFEQHYRETTEIVFSGGNYNVDPADFEDDPPEPQEEPARERAKKTAVYVDELEKLVNVVASRVLATAEGRYYTYDGFTPKSLYRCAAIDMAVIWLAIASCLDDVAKAKSYVAQVVGRAYERSGVDTEKHDGFRRCFDEAELLASSVLEKGSFDGGWFGEFLVLAFAYVYDRDLSGGPAKIERQRELGASAFGMGAHVWPLYADVANCLGDNMGREFLGQSDPGAH